MERTEESIFAIVIEKKTPAERAEFLREACGGHPALRNGVESLLAAYSDGEFLESPAVAIGMTAEVDLITEKPGSQIGPYKIRELLAEGGMGIVFVAEQNVPVRRKVALKIIKPGLATKDVLARFEAERQALAMMDHPNIARVFDGGTTDSGQPFFVMELVRGFPINDYCDELRLSTRERLELFMKVCNAVQHAHHKGIIHRDIKPSNILVAEIDGLAVPKVIDFGVAKAVSQKLTEETLYTNFSQIIGTPLYMSPEQAGSDMVDIDTRSDVYSLGVLLYELLTGQTPVDSETLKNSGLDEFRRILREDDPQRPSEVVSTLRGDVLKTLSILRQVEPSKIREVFRGELDWIVMKALAKDRSRRYESASALSADVQRLLDDEPVLACPPNATYRIKKLLRKHKLAFSGVAILTIVLVTGVAGLLVSNILIKQQRDAAIQAKQGEEIQRAEAEHQKQIAEQNFQLARDTVDKLVESLSSAPEAIDAETSWGIQQSLLEMSLKYYTMFISQRAHDQTLQADLGKAYWLIGQLSLRVGTRSDAIEAHRNAYKINEQLVVSNPENLSYQLALAHSCRKISEFERREGNFAASRELSNRALTIADQLCRTEPSVEHRHLLSQAYNQVSKDYRLAGDRAEAVRYMKDAIRIRRDVVRDAPDHRMYSMFLVAQLQDLAGIYRERSQSEESLHLIQEAIRICEETSANGENLRLHARLSLAGAYLDLARTYAESDKYARAFENAHTALSISSALTDTNPKLKLARWGLIHAYHELSVFAQENEQHLDCVMWLRNEIQEWRILVEQDRSNWTNHRNLVRALERLATIQRDASESQEAAVATADATAEWRRLAKQFPNRREITREWGWYLWRLSRTHRALEQTNEEISRLWDCVHVREQLASRHPQDLELHQEVVAAYRDLAKCGSDDPAPDIGLAWFLVTTKNEEIRNAEQAIELAKSAGCDDDYVPFCWYILGMAHWQLGNEQQAHDWYDKAERWMTDSQATDEELLQFQASARKVLGTADP